MMRQTGFKRPAYERAPLPPPQRIVRGRPAVIEPHVQAHPKNPRYVDRHLLDMARGQPCLLQSPICCNDPETTVACHGAGVHLGKGMGYKVGEQYTVHGCHACNHYTDAYGGATAEEKAAVFAAGHARQVALWVQLAVDSGAPVRDRASARSALAKLDNFYI